MEERKCHVTTPGDRTRAFRLHVADRRALLRHLAHSQPTQQTEGFTKAYY